MPVYYSVQVRTHTGCVREINEDLAQTVLDWPQAPASLDSLIALGGHLFAVADGMGGHAAGDVAARTAIDALFQAYYSYDEQAIDANLRAAIARGNEAIRQKASADTMLAGMGTTLVAAVLHEQTLTVAHVGDSRAYLFREGHLERLTRDHSWVEEQRRAGVLNDEEARRHPYRNVVTRSLGPDRDAHPDLLHVDVQPHDLLLLCSDGLSNLLTDEELQRFMAAYSLDEAADNMLELALERGAPDNVTFVLVQIMATATRKQRRLWPWMLSVLILLTLVTILFRGRLRPLLSGLPATPTIAQPAVSPTSPPPSATPTAAPPVAARIPVDFIELSADTPDAGARFGDQDAQSRRRGRPLPEYYVLYVSGPLVLREASSQSWRLALAQQDHGEHVYRFSIDGPLEAPLPEVGSWVGLVGRPQVEDDLEGDSLLVPQLLLDAKGRPVWVAGGNLATWLQDYSRPMWVFSVFGRGGGNDLGIDTPVGAEGEPMVMWGSWSLSEGDTVQFNALDPKPYVWQEDGYR